MDFIDHVRALAERANKHAASIKTEEATKNALVMPFIQALGYDVFNPTEVVPEFIADIGTKKGEKIDYAIMIEGQPVIMFECKALNQPLEAHNSQLFRYFGAVKGARFGVLTNGVIYQLFSDIEAPNVMDVKPFLEVNLLDLQEDLVEELKRLAKSFFNLEEMLSVAVQLKYTREIKRLLAQELTEPSDDFIRYFVARVHPGRATTTIRELFSTLLKDAFKQFLAERIAGRLKSAALADENAQKVAEVIEEEAKEEGMSPIEIDGYNIVRAIVREAVSVDRIFHRDTQKYCGILLDDSRKKPICRLYFNNPEKLQLALFDANKEENLVSLERLDDIYKHAQQLKNRALLYDQEKSKEGGQDKVINIAS
jgi:hypothetical protein